MNVNQSIQKPFGINVFGSSIIRVEPDIALLTFAVSRLEQKPRDAFRTTREAAQKVRAYLAQEGITDVGSSRITLAPSFRYSSGEQHFVGYLAKITFRVLLRDLDQMEILLSGVVDAGANDVSPVELQTSRLKEIRAEARRRAIEAAREKAENYCKAAGVTVGVVNHIEDVDPNLLRGTAEGHVMRETQTDDDEGALSAFDPGSIAVGAAVVVSFEFGTQ
jgi:uncharacterized protein